MGKGVENWLTSVEVRKVLKISACDLAHLREEGAIGSTNRGNAYYYAATDVEALRVRSLLRQAGFCPLDQGDR